MVAACALEREVTVGEAIAAAALGYELTVRLGESAGPEHRQRFHLTATAGTVGASGAAARLLGADDAAVAAAVGHAVSVAGGSLQAIVERSGTRFLHRAHAASTGLACARAACSGLGATRHGLESGRGAFAAAPEAPAVNLLASRPTTCLEETGYRLHAATGFAQAAVDAALAIGRLDPLEVERVTVTVSPPAAAALASNPTPADAEEAWWSIEHAVAVCLAAGDADALAGGLTGRQDVLALCGRIEVEPGGSGWEAAVEAVLGGGSVRTAAVDCALGHAGRPASDDDLTRKWRRLTGADGASFLARLLVVDDAAPFASVLEEAFAASPGAAELLS